MKITRLIVAAVLVTSQVATANRYCRDDLPIVGYAECTRFGTSWHGVATAWWELGVESMHFVPSAFDTTPTTQIVANNGAVTAAGASFRWLESIGRTWFFGPELGLASVTHSPQLVADVVEHGVMSTMDTTTEGLVARSELLVGVHRTFGLVTVAAALGAGARLAWLQVRDVPGESATHVSGLVEPHVKADAWLTPNVTLGVSAALNVLDRDDYTVGMTLGLHLLPYDRTR